ncbi:hypothetical protein QUF64_01000 [Anaerolineales bacterium HSG6]|nr:hypothetical protein [Anaerolineales bacterium HSG6]
MISRKNLIFTSLIGLVGALLLTLLSIVVVRLEWVPIIFSYYILAYIFFGSFLILSLAEVPLMLYAMHQIANSKNPSARKALLMTNTGYVAFGAIYGAMFIVLTGYEELGALLALLSVARFVTSLIFLRNTSQQV